MPEASPSTDPSPLPESPPLPEAAPLLPEAAPLLLPLLPPLPLLLPLLDVDPLPLDCMDVSAVPSLEPPPSAPLSVALSLPQPTAVIPAASSATLTTLRSGILAMTAAPFGPARSKGTSPTFHFASHRSA